MDTASVSEMRRIESCQFLEPQQNISLFLNPEQVKSLQEHLDWIRENIKSWLPNRLKDKHAEIFKEIFADYEKKKPFWLRKNVNEYEIYIEH